MMNKALANTKIFVSAYIVFMLPTYFLPYLGSKSYVIQGLDATWSSLFILPLVLHLGAILALLWICLVRGAIIGENWLVALPMVVLAFEFISKLSAIPFVPSMYHLAAIIIGAGCPVISDRNPSKSPSF